MKNKKEKNIRKRKTPQKRSFWFTFMKNQKKTHTFLITISIVISIIKPLFDMLMELLKLFSK